METEVRIRLIVLLFSLFFCHSSFADWSVAVTKVRNSRALLQKEVSANEGKPIVAVMCIPEPTLIVDWFEKPTNISVSIDTVQLDVPGQFAIHNGMQAITLKPVHLQGLINGMHLQLKATLQSGEIVTAETSLRGFTSAFDKAELACASTT